MKNNILSIGTGSIAKRHVENIFKIDKNNKIDVLSQNFQRSKNFCKKLFIQDLGGDLADIPNILAIMPSQIAHKVIGCSKFWIWRLKYHISERRMVVTYRLDFIFCQPSLLMSSTSPESMKPN